MIYHCRYCDRQFASAYGQRSHENFHKPGYYERDTAKTKINMLEAHKKWVEVANLKREKRISEYNKNPTICLNCTKIMNYQEAIEKGKKFCCRSCSAIFYVKKRKEEGWSHSPETIQRISSKIKAQERGKDKREAWAKNPKQCKICSNSLSFDRRYYSSCSEECSKLLRSEIGRKGGRISAAKQTRRSKHEIEMYDLCKSHFKNVEHNKPIFAGWDADILIYDHKIAVMWNGDWHYVEMGFAQSLLQVQTRDNYRIKKMLEAEWIPYPIEDSTKNPKQPKQAFVELLDFIDKMVVRENFEIPTRGM